MCPCGFGAIPDGLPLQWLAASRAGRFMRYFPWDNVDLAGMLPDLSDRLSGQPVGRMLDAVRTAPATASIPAVVAAMPV